MSGWKKVIVSGSNAELANLTATGADIKLTNLPAGSNENVVLVDSSTGALKKIAMSSVTGANTTYSLDTSLSGANGVITLTDSDGGTDTITLAAGAHITMSESGDTITISSTDTVYSHPTQGTINTTFSGIEVPTAIVVNSLGHTTTVSKGNIQSASTSQKGVVQLSDSTGSTSTSQAATANAVKQVADAIANLDGGLSSLTSGEVTQLQNINSVTISNTQWGYLGSMNQGVAQGDSVTFAGVTSGGTISGSTVNASTANITELNVNGSATMTGSLVFNGVSFTETATLTNTGSNTFGANGTTQTFSGSTVFMEAPTFNAPLGVSSGGTGLSTISSGNVLLGNGTGNISTVDATADGTFLVGDGSTMVAESGATLRTSIGVGTSDTPQFTGINLGHASDTTLTRESAGDVNIEGNIIYRAGGTDVPVTDGGTGVSTLTSGEVLIGNGSSAVQTRAIGIADNNIVEIDSSGVAGAPANGDYAKFTANGLAGRNFAEVRSDLGLTALVDATIATDGAAGVANGETGLVTGNAVYDYIAAQNFGTGTGDISAVTAGDGLTGGGTSGAVTLNVVGGNGLTATADEIALDAALTTVTSIKNNSLVIGRSSGNDLIDFATDSEIKLKTNNTERLKVSDSGVSVTGTLTCTDLTVTGTTTTVNTTNVTVQDAFIALGTGAQQTNTDAGIIFGAGTGVQGDALFWDGSYNGNDGRLGVAHSVALDDNSATAGYWVGGVIEGDAAAAATALADHKGNIRIDSGEIYIYV